jgi:hypothetical protein
MSAPARGHLKVAPQDRGSQARSEYFQNDLFPPAMLQHRVASSHANVADPVRLLAAHRHQIPLPA